MAGKQRIVVTGTGAVCAAGRDPAEIFQRVNAGQSALAPISRWRVEHWPVRIAGEVTDMKPRDLVPNRKTHKFIRRSRRIRPCDH